VLVALLKIFNFIREKMFQIFAPSLKKKLNICFGTLAYFAVDSKIKIFFPALFFFISKKLHHYYNQ